MSEVKKPKPGLLLHVCCGPCSTPVVERLRSAYDITCFFYNPNIHPESEYSLRSEEAEGLAERLGLRFLEGEYDSAEWFRRTSGLEAEPEGGRRCEICFRIRLERTAREAAKQGVMLFGTTLTVSPHKDAGLVNRLGEDVSRGTGVSFLSGDWKKADGFKRSVELSREHGLYRQNYCGCTYSMGRKS